MLLGGEVALHGVHHDVRARRCRLVSGCRIGELGVHDGKEGPPALAVVRVLEHPVPERVDVHDRGVRGLRAGAGERGDGAERGDPVGAHLVHEEVLEVEVVGEAVGDGLRGIDHGPAADGEDEVDALAPAELDAALCERETRVGHDAAEFHVLDALLGEALLDAGEKAGVAHMAASPVDEDLVAAELLDETARLQLGVPAEDHLGWDEVFEVDHGTSFRRGRL